MMKDELFGQEIQVEPTEYDGELDFMLGNNGEEEIDYGEYIDWMMKMYEEEAKRLRSVEKW